MASKGVNKVILIDFYQSGMSIPEVADETGASRSAVRYHLEKAGVLRSRADGVRNAGKRERLGTGMLGKSREFSEAHKLAMQKARKEWAEKHAKGTRVTPSGYVEFTTGPNKGRSAHVVRMEDRLGRPLKEDECVHHIDGDRQNNNDNNLALLTRSGHARLHRREDDLQGIKPRRNSNGTWR
jgi:hypothetical protein